MLMHCVYNVIVLFIIVACRIRSPTYYPFHMSIRKLAVSRPIFTEWLSQGLAMTNV